MTKTTQHGDDIDPQIAKKFAVFGEVEPPRNWPPARRHTTKTTKLLPSRRLAAAVAAVGLVVVGGAVAFLFLGARTNTQTIEAGEPRATPTSSDSGESFIAPTRPFPDGFESFDVSPTLSARVGHSVTWTGADVLIWGGALGEGLGTAFSDGARFSPSTGTWMPVATGPLTARSHTHTAWTGSELLIVGGLDANGQTLTDGAAYSLDTDSWRSLPPLPTLSQHSESVWTGEALIIWDRSADSVYSLDPLDEWVQLPDSGLGEAESLGALRWAGARLIALSVAPGGMQTSAALTPEPDAKWQPLETIDFATDGFVGDPFPSNAVVVDDKLIVWSRSGEDADSYALEPNAVSWVASAPVPIAPCEGHIVPLALGRQAAVAIDLCSSGDAPVLALYDATIETWRLLDYPDGDWPDLDYAVWTGDEVVAVAAACCDQFDLSGWQSWRLRLSQ